MFQKSVIYLSPRCRGKDRFQRREGQNRTFRVRNKKDKGK